MRPRSVDDVPPGRGYSPSKTEEEARALVGELPWARKRPATVQTIPGVRFPGRKFRNESRASLWRVVNYKRTLQFVSGGPGKPFCFFHFYATSSMERQWNATSKLQLLLMGGGFVVEISSGHATLAIQDGTSWLSHIDLPDPGAASRDGSFSAIVHGTAVSKALRLA